MFIGNAISIDHQVFIPIIMQVILKITVITSENTHNAIQYFQEFELSFSGVTWS